MAINDAWLHDRDHDAAQLGIARNKSEMKQELKEAHLWTRTQRRRGRWSLEQLYAVPGTLSERRIP